MAIPTARDAGWQARAVWVERTGLVANSFRHLALKVRSDLARRGAKSVLVTSALPSDGKTLTACNLALALASMSGGERVALLDLDLRNPGVARSMGVRCSTGLDDVLSGSAPLEAALIRTDVPHLDLYPVRRGVRSAHEYLSRPRFAEALAELTRRYGILVCDSPPALPVPDVELITPHVGACLAVVRAGKTSSRAFRDLIRMLPRQKAIGCFLNAARAPRHARQYYHHAGYAETDEAREVGGAR